MGSANGGGKEIICSASGGCTMMGSAAVVCESAVMFSNRLLKILRKESQSGLLTV